MNQSAKSMTTIDEGEVFYIGKGGGPALIPAVRKEIDQRKSKQVRDKRYFEQHGLIPYPFEPSALLLLQENCSFFDSCVRQIASDVVGQGWLLKLKKNQKENDKVKEDVEKFLRDPNDSEEDIADVIEQCIIDWGGIGWYGIEIERDGEMIIGAWHVPAHTFKVHKSKEKFLQIRNNERVWFKAFGSDLQISAKTGDEVVGKRNLANELIYYKRYYPPSDYYGAPPILPAVGSVKGLIGIRDYNLAFFENYGVPAALIVLKGRWSKDASRMITNFFDVEIKGSENQHKTLVLKPPKDGDVDWKELQTKLEEAGFKVYIRILRDEVLACYKMPPYRIGIAELGSLGGSTAVEMTRIYAQSIVAPLKRTTQKMVTKMILLEGLGCKEYSFEWNELDIRDLTAIAKRMQTLMAIGAITPNIAAKECGYPEFGTAGDQHYIQSNYIPIGEETVEKMRGLLESTILELSGKMDELGVDQAETQEIIRLLKIES